MKPGPADRPLLYLLLGLTAALTVVLPVGAISLWGLLDAEIYRDGPGRLKPMIAGLVVLGEFLLIRRFRRLQARIRGI
ncbi:MAG: hypothetical protein SGI90_00490 [Candidatus Eisenbacteria bacterium]|nr:hypothetical protein [Candidatus Eisenbacteria bacterium]